MLNSIMKGKRPTNSTSQVIGKSPLTLTLTDDGKTLAVFYKHCTAAVIARLLAIMGEPELVCPGEYNPDVVWFLWPHQDMNDDLRTTAERMTSSNLLSSIGYYDS